MIRFAVIVASAALAGCSAPAEKPADVAPDIDLSAPTAMPVQNGVVGTNSNDDIRIWTDPHTGCEYIMYQPQYRTGGNMLPRTEPFGPGTRQMGCKYD